ncbi:hypothetical protein I312_100833 [Cryptococcus bacillisporus CA1280]|uniref:uncharacterized protein n=1 Tax=Cryptococcus bacillisporus CA1280 TaxID=1296109 RepID=UPI00336613AC
MQNLEMELNKPLAQEEVGTSFVKVIRTEQIHHLFAKRHYTILFMASDEFHSFRLTSAPPAVRPAPFVSLATHLSFFLPAY